MLLREVLEVVLEVRVVRVAVPRGVEGDAVGGYLSRRELEALKASWARATADDRLAPEHRAFLRELTFDFNGFPQYRGRHAGIGGTYRLRRP